MQCIYRATTAKIYISYISWKWPSGLSIGKQVGREDCYRGKIAKGKESIDNVSECDNDTKTTLCLKIAILTRFIVPLEFFSRKCFIVVIHCFQGRHKVHRSFNTIVSTW